MDVVLLVDGVDGEDHLSHVELGHVLWETVLKLTEQSQQVPAHVVVHDQVLQHNTGELEPPSHDCSFSLLFSRVSEPWK